tara:strand:+ start:2132 stop:2530 length:399 start_codon:yes stop_codon:yes gene_type:complete
MEDKIDDKLLVSLGALLIHAAKIDESYTSKEEQIINQFINKFTENESKTAKLLIEAKSYEENSNQLLNFTKNIKKNSLEFKTKVVKELWKIILSDSKSDEYESNLMRRICGLIYFPDTLNGQIKNKIIKTLK